MGSKELIVGQEASYELYCELASELCDPIDDPDLTLDLRYELYHSRLIYLKNLHEQCFIAMNTKEHSDKFSEKDLIVLKKAMEVTKDFLRFTIFESIKQSLRIAEKKNFHAARTTSCP